MPGLAGSENQAVQWGLFGGDAEAEPKRGSLVLRDYQLDALESLRRLIRDGAKDGRRRFILSAPTGSGKTAVASYMMQSCIEKGNRALFIADRNALVAQTSEKLHEYGLDHGMMQAENTWGGRERIIVASSQTIEARMDRQPRFLEGFDLVVVDEAHTMRKKLLAELQRLGVVTIGLTATPMARGLGRWYSGVVTSRSTNELIEDKWLVPMEVYIAQATVNMAGIRPTGPGGEWTDDQAAAGAADIVCDIVSEWADQCQRHFGGPVKSLVFVPTVVYGAELTEQFNSLGYRWRQVSYKHSTAENQESIQMLKEGELDGLISVEALTKGLDITDVQYIGCARKYRSGITQQIQIYGRGMRSHPGKTRCLLVDHARNFLAHGNEIDKFWRNGWDWLDDGKRKKRKRAIPKEDATRQCGNCRFVMPRKCLECPMCGHRNQRPGSEVTSVDGRLVKWKPMLDDVGDIWPDVCQLAAEKHCSDSEKAFKMALAQYKAITGKWPKWGRPFAPGGECRPQVREAAQAEYRIWKRSRKKSVPAESS